MSLPWSVEEDANGITRVFVKESHLVDFPQFMKDIIDKKIGLEKGVFKMTIVDRQGGTDLNTMLNLVKRHYTTLRSETKQTSSGILRKVRCYPEVKMQTFKCSKANNLQLYGYLDALRTSAEIKRDREDFLKSVESPETFLTESTCWSVDDLLEHYWKEIAASAAEDVPITYGAGIPIEEDDIMYGSNFTLSKLGTILDLCPISYPGIQKPFLYVGSEHATFPWHIEDGALFSINVLHYGAPCLWHFVPPYCYDKFVQHIKYFPLDLSQTSCMNVLGHKHILASKDFLLKLGISVNTVVQEENDILVIYPFAAHSGFKCGRNLQVAANFADPWWIEPAILAPTCACFVTQINLDLKEFIAVARPHLLSDYLDNNYLKLYKELEKNEFICKLGILPSVSSDEKLKGENNGLLMSGPEPASQVLAVQEPAPEAPAAKGTASEEAVDEVQFSGARCTIFCPLRPLCKKSFVGGRCKLPRMKKHIIKEHGGDLKLIDKLSLIYPPKQIPKTKGSDCSFCGHFISGTSFHMIRHVQRQHSK